MRISDWSSDVCSSDLRSHVAVATRRRSAPNEEQVSLRGRDFGARQFQLNREDGGLRSDARGRRRVSPRDLPQIVAGFAGKRAAALQIGRVPGRSRIIGATQDWIADANEHQAKDQNSVGEGKSG